MIIPKGKLIIIGGAVDMNTSLGSQEYIVKPDYLKFFEQGILKRIITESAKTDRINCRGNYHCLPNPGTGGSGIY